MAEITYDYFTDLRDTFRQDVLAAMDRSMNELLPRIGCTPTRNDIGARDADLPRLFRALDDQFERNLKVAGFTVEGREPIAG